ncbi:MAG: 1-acyl-sn-glycerol-3-phosphate acyltransferase [bacterium]|nr:1-acyl-sn-glycerol-3-phosphate acyltransferase [bacterium]
MTGGARTPLVYRATRRMFLMLAAPLFAWRGEGREKFPRSGPAIAIALHRSWLDPPCVGGACPRAVRFLILDSVYRKPWARFFYRSMRAIPVGRPGGTRVGNLRAALGHLRDGGVLGIFPQGRVVVQGLGDVLPGTAMLALHGRAPIVPIDIRGSARAWPHRGIPRPARVRVRIGDPIAPPEARGREALATLQRRIEEALDALMRGEDRGAES